MEQLRKTTRSQTHALTTFSLQPLTEVGLELELNLSPQWSHSISFHLAGCTLCPGYKQTRQVVKVFIIHLMIYCCTVGFFFQIIKFALLLIMDILTCTCDSIQGVL